MEERNREVLEDVHMLIFSLGRETVDVVPGIVVKLLLKLVLDNLLIESF
jgi:hypothetical protein